MNQYKNHQPLDNPSEQYDYSRVEDIAGVDYQQGIKITLLLLAANLLWLSFPLSFFGMIITTALAVASWYYFKAYFDAHNDANTSRSVMIMIGAHIAFAIAYLLIYSTDWIDLFAGGVVELLFCIFTGTCKYENNMTIYILVHGLILVAFVAAISNFVAGLRILWVNHQYPFPLKRIALSSMILLPVLFIYYFGMGIFNEPEPSFIGRVILCTPYFFLLHHFYRADQDDRTR